MQGCGCSKSRTESSLKSNGSFRHYQIQRGHHNATFDQIPAARVQVVGGAANKWTMLSMHRLCLLRWRRKDLADKRPRVLAWRFKASDFKRPPGGRLHSPLNDKRPRSWLMAKGACRSSAVLSGEEVFIT
jgi:hypothetical protein